MVHSWGGETGRFNLICRYRRSCDRQAIIGHRNIGHLTLRNIGHLIIGHRVERHLVLGASRKCIGSALLVAESMSICFAFNCEAAPPAAIAFTSACLAAAAFKLRYAVNPNLLEDLCVQLSSTTTRGTEIH